MRADGAVLFAGRAGPALVEAVRRRRLDEIAGWPRVADRRGRSGGPEVALLVDQCRCETRRLSRQSEVSQAFAGGGLVTNDGEHTSSASAGAEEHLQGPDSSQKAGPLHPSSTAAGEKGQRGVWGRLGDNAGAPGMGGSQDAMKAGEMFSGQRDEPGKPLQEGQ